MKYLMLIRHAEAYRSEPIPEKLLEAMGGFMEEKTKSGALKNTAGLAPTAQGFRVSARHGKLNVTDGPFTEAKEIIGGYALVDVQSKDEARDFARQFVELHRTHWPAFEFECEVRALEQG